MKIALIADDLTGANNAGVRLARQGFSTATVMHGSASLPAGYDAICIDTDSRYLSAGDARQRVADAANRMRGSGATLFCKRIDTLLRGNIGAEIDGVLGASPPDAIAVVSAAFPDAHRIVSDGHLLVDGEPVNRNAVAAGDPISPVRHSYIADVIAEQSRERVAVIRLETVSRGRNALASELAAAGSRVVVVDAATNEHIETLAHAMAKLHRQFIPVDPGPLSAAYARLCFAADHASGPKVLAAVGSTTALTSQQVAYALRHWEIDAIRVRAEVLASTSSDRSREIEKAVAAALEHFKRSRLAVVTTADPSSIVDLHARAKKENTAPRVLATRIAQGLAEISSEIIARSYGAIGACYSSGGDVTAAFYAHAAANGFEIVEEVMPLIAHVRFVGGAFDGLPMVTKGGSVGIESTMSDCLQFLFARLDRAAQKP